jgi:hypothetical protein
MTPLHISAINRHPQGDVNSQEYVILIHQSYITVLKMYNSSGKYNIDIMASILLKYSWIKFIDTLPFTVCVTCIQASSLISKFSIQTDQVPEVGDLSLKHVGGFKCVDNL